MTIRGNVLWITRTAVFTALLVTMQLVTTPLGNQIVTGSINNLIMIVSLLTCGLATGMVVGIISPICVSMMGFGPAFPPIIPFIVIGNAIFILVWFLLRKLNKADNSIALYKVFNYSIAILAAVIKFLILYTTIVKFAMPFLLDLNEAQSVVLSLAFSYPQIITAMIGGVIALTISPRLHKALKIDNL